MTEAGEQQRVAAARRATVGAPKTADWQQWKRYWIRDTLLGGLNYSLHYGCRALPIDACSAIGGALGRLNGQHRYHKVRARAEDIYKRLSPHPVTDEETAAAVGRCFDNSGRVMLEFSVLDRLWPAGRIAVEGAEYLLEPRRHGQPVIVMGLHLGNWETIGPTIVELGFRGSKGFYQPPRNRFDHKIVVVARERYGAIMLPMDLGGTRAAHRHLVEDRGILLVYADEERSGYICMPLFGRPVPLRANVANIIKYAWASGALVVPAYCERLGGRAQFRVTYLPAVDVVPEGSDPAAALVENVHRIDRVITPLIQAHLDQWYMLLESKDWV